MTTVGEAPACPRSIAYKGVRFKTINDLDRNDWRRGSPRFQGENFASNLETVDKIREIAREKGCTPSQLALAWLLARGNDVVPIPGTSSRQRLEENVAAVKVNLSRGDLERIEAAAPKGAAAGARYSDAGMRLVNV